MKIVSISILIIHVNHRGDWLHVVVETDAGITGVGEASHSGNDALCAAAVEQFDAILQGADPRQIARIRQLLRRKDGGRVYNTALSGLEQALWDVLAQALGVPLHVLFGGAVRDRLRLYANINRHVTDRSPDGFARAARQAADEGFTAVKMAPFDELAPSLPLSDRPSCGLASRCRAGSGGTQSNRRSRSSWRWTVTAGWRFRRRSWWVGSWRSSTCSGMRSR